MRTFFFMGRNLKNVSGVSWKIWKIERKGRRLTVWWGAATLVRRKPVPTGTLQTDTWTLRTVEEAEQEMQKRIRQKLNKGYQRNAKRRSAKQ